VVRTLRPNIGRAFDPRCAKPPVHKADPELLTPEHRAWREEVLRRAGFRCEWIEEGRRCEKAEPLHRMFADHIRERRDGGPRFDPANGMCLCGRHHTLKTHDERAKRMRA
jgi:hypothetical protein